MHLRSSCDSHVDIVIGKLKHEYSEGLSCSAGVHKVMWKFKLREGVHREIYHIPSFFFTYITKQMI